MRDPREFEKNNVLYHDPVNGDKLKIGKFCSIACGAKFPFTSGNHALNTRSPSFSKNGIWIRKTSGTLGTTRATSWWGNDVWIGYEAVVLSGVTIGDGAIIGTRAVVTKDVPPYTIVGGVPARPIRRRFDEETVARLQALRWWDWDAEKIARSIHAIQTGDLNALAENA